MLIMNHHDYKSRKYTCDYCKIIILNCSFNCKYFIIFGIVYYAYTLFFLLIF